MELVPAPGLVLPAGSPSDERPPNGYTHGVGQVVQNQTSGSDRERLVRPRSTTTCATTRQRARQRSSTAPRSYKGVGGAIMGLPVGYCEWDSGGRNLGVPGRAPATSRSCTAPCARQRQPLYRRGDLPRGLYHNHRRHFRPPCPGEYSTSTNNATRPFWAYGYTSFASDHIPRPVASSITTIP